MRLGEEEIQTQLAQLEDWEWKDSKWIEKRYRFPDFLTGISFVNRIAEAAERQNHHPFIGIEYRVVTLRLTTWRAGGLTPLDFELAKEFDRLQPPAKLE